jgi:hypothetical protein
MKVFEDQGQLTVEIGPARRLSRVLRDGWLVAVSLGMAYALTRIAPPPELVLEFAISVAARVALALLSLLGALRLLWKMLGQEEIVLRGGLLTVVWRLGLLGWQRSYPVTEVRDLHVSGIGTPQLLRIIGGTLAFQNKGGTRRFADRLERDEAKTLLQHFRARLPNSNWTPVLGL